MRYKHAVVTAARWEAARIAEWVSYYRSIGYDHAYLYSNDDDPAEFVQAILPFLEGADPFVTYHHCRAIGAQRWMLLHCLETYGHEFEWVSLFDVDEFLSLRGSTSIEGFVGSFPCDTDSIYVNWTFFGHAGHATRPAGSVLLNYTRRQHGLDPHTKTITRRAAISCERIRAHSFVEPEPVRFNHGWSEAVAPGMRRVNVLGDDMARYYDEFAEAADYLAPRTQAIFSSAVLHHYAFQSCADLQRRVARGTTGDHAAQTHWRVMEQTGGAGRFLATLDEVEDVTLRDFWRRHLGQRCARPMIPAPGSINVALGKECAQSSAASAAAMTPAAAVSGQIGARASFITAEQDAPWWQVDLGARHWVDSMLIFNRLDDHPARSANLQIWLSDAGYKWRRVFRKDDGVPFGGADGRPLIWTPATPCCARHVRIALTGTAQLHLNQVEIYGRPAV